MRSATLAALLMLALPASSVVANDDFSGAWTAALCPADVTPDSGLCSSFVLELHQKEGKVCGTHLFASAGAARVDEGAAPSLFGDIADGTASVVVVSGRGSPPVRVRVEMKKVSGALRWQRLDSPRGDFLLPQSARMTRARAKTLFAPLFEQELKAACLSAFAMSGEIPPPPKP